MSALLSVHRRGHGWHGRAAAVLRRAAAFLLLLCLWPAAMAQPQPAEERVRESQVKAAFLHKFPSFVEWPAGIFPRPDTPLRIGVLGNDALLQDLTDLARERDRDGRPVQAVRIAPGEPLTGFHILYLKGPTARIGELLPQVPDGVLTVADADGIHPRGSVISFFLEDARVRFAVSVDSATRQRLRLSSRLLQVARNVQGSAEPHVDGAALAAGPPHAGAVQPH